MYGENPPPVPGDERLIRIDWKALDDSTPKKVRPVSESSVGTGSLDQGREAVVAEKLHRLHHVVHHSGSAWRRTRWIGARMEPEPADRVVERDINR